MYDKKNIAVFLIAIIYFIFFLNKSISFSIIELIIVMLLIILLQLIKMFRLYLIFLDEQIGIEKLSLAYFSTTFINIVLPYRLGEIYRIFRFGQICNNFKMGFIGILIDRLFDSFILVTLFLVSRSISENQFSFIYFILIFFVVAVFFFYIFFSQMYSIINCYLVTSKLTKRSLMALDILNTVNEFYKVSRRLVKGKVPILLLCSSLAWILEYFVIKFVTSVNNEMYNLSLFINFIGNEIVMINDPMFGNYMILHAMTLLLYIVFILIFRKVSNR